MMARSHLRLVVVGEPTNPADLRGDAYFKALDDVVQRAVHDDGPQAVTEAIDLVKSHEDSMAAEADALRAEATELRTELLRAIYSREFPLALAKHDLVTHAELLEAVRSSTLAPGADVWACAASIQEAKRAAVGP